MSDIEIRRADAADAERLHAALCQLSTDLNDTHMASLDDMLRHGFSGEPAFFALLAIRKSDDRTVGALLASPVFSTTRGGAGLYVSDLWVDSHVRGAGLGQRLLAAAVDLAPENWSVTFVKLAVYHDNPDAQRFYERLGFKPRKDETVFDLMGPELENLRKRP
ncbi:N-acetyltransferase family protein [Roseibium sp.]|uniref:GNAT family N-acetyltransferase n=1 Tax=Roseibium sp. TaxID=1936156 RepID=UPI003D12C302